MMNKSVVMLTVLLLVLWIITNNGRFEPLIMLIQVAHLHRRER